MGLLSISADVSFSGQDSLGLRERGKADELGYQPGLAARGGDSLGEPGSEQTRHGSNPGRNAEMQNVNVNVKEEADGSTVCR